MRFIERLLLIVGGFCLGLYGFFTVQAWRHQDELQSELQLEQQQQLTAPHPIPSKLAEGDMVGRLEIPRLNLSVMVMEGTGDRTLRLGAGHIRGTSYPGSGG